MQTGQGVSVTLDGVADDGLAGEDDNVGSAVEHVNGADGDDRIVGNPADNELRGEAGDDELIGGDGADRLLGSGGADVMRGGAGDDTFDPNFGFNNPDGAIDTIDCGPGDDLVRGPEPHDILIDCERIVGV